MAFFMNSFKYTIFLVNLIFFGLGLFLFYNTYQQLSDDVFNLDGALKSPIYFTLAIAAIIVFILFLGCCGTCNESACMIKTYAGLILICVILQVAAVVMVYRIDSNEISKDIKDNLISNFYNQSTSAQKSIQLVQNNNKCCGVFDYKDYNVLTALIPNSCCGKYNEGKQKSDAHGECHIGEFEGVQGCKARLEEQISGNYKYVYIILGSVFLFQLIIVILSCALSKNIREQYNVV